MAKTPSPVSRLMAEALTGRISRREIARRAAALGLSAPIVDLMMNSRAAAAQGTPAAGDQAVGYSIELPEWLNRDFEGARVIAILGAEGPATPFENEAISRFQEATGIEVNRVFGPESATERLAQYQQLLGAQSSDADAMMIDVIWPGILAQHAVDLTDALQANAEAGGYEYFERIVANNTVDDKLVGIPWYTDAGILYYRSDLFEKYGIEGPPETWQELTEMAQTIMDGEREGGNPDFFGFVFQGAAYEGLTCNALEWQASYGGGTIVNENAEVVVNNEATAAAFDLARSWVGTIAPAGVTGYMEEDARAVWQGGNAAFMRNWPYAYALAQEPGSTIAGNVGIAILPQGEGPDARHADTLGGWQMMVSQYSQNQEAAVLFARYMTSLPLQRSFAIERSLLPTIPQLYDDEEVTRVNPFFADLRDVFLGGAVARPSTVTGDLYNEVSTIYYTGVNRILSGQDEVQPALEDLQEALQEVADEL